MYRLNAGMFWDKTEGMESHCGRRGDDKDEDTNKHRHLGTVYELQIHLIPSLTLTLPALKEQPCLITSLHTHTHTPTHTRSQPISESLWMSKSSEGLDLWWVG